MASRLPIRALEKWAAEFDEISEEDGERPRATDFVEWLTPDIKELASSR